MNEHSKIETIISVIMNILGGVTMNKNKLSSKVAGNLKNAREELGLTLSSVAKNTGIRASTLSKIENGFQQIDVSLVAKLAEHYGVKINHIIEIEEREVGDQRKRKLDEVMKKVLEGYEQASKEAFKDNKMSAFIRHDFVRTIFEQMNLSKERYAVTGSAGKGRWALVPWVSVFNKDITTTATRGYYIVYVFTEDMKGVYISLNQGWTYFLEKYGAKEGRSKIRKTANLLRPQIDKLPQRLRETSIDLMSNGNLATGYESGHIFGRYYAVDDMPNNEELLDDLGYMLEAYDSLSLLMQNKTTEQFNDALLLTDDGEYLETNEEAYQAEINNDLIIKERTATYRKNKKENEDTLIPRKDPIILAEGEEKWPRNATIAASALSEANYKCRWNKEHETFYVATGEHRYMEAHHLIPMSAQGDFDYSLDQTENIVSLCPNCHRQIHHSFNEEREDMIRHFYKEYRDQLEDKGIEVTFTQLKTYYGI